MNAAASRGYPCTLHPEVAPPASMSQESNLANFDVAYQDKSSKWFNVVSNKKGFIDSMNLWATL